MDNFPKWHLPCGHVPPRGCSHLYTQKTLPIPDLGAEPHASQRSCFFRASHFLSDSKAKNKYIFRIHSRECRRETPSALRVPWQVLCGRYLKVSSLGFFSLPSFKFKELLKNVLSTWPASSSLQNLGICLYVYVHAVTRSGQKRATDSLGSGVTAGCEPPGLCAGNPIGFLSKTSKYFTN